MGVSGCTSGVGAGSVVTSVTLGNAFAGVSSGEMVGEDVIWDTAPSSVGASDGARELEFLLGEFVELSSESVAAVSEDGNNSFSVSSSSSSATSLEIVVEVVSEPPIGTIIKSSAVVHPNPSSPLVNPSVRSFCCCQSWFSSWSKNLFMRIKVVAPMAIPIRTTIATATQSRRRRQQDFWGGFFLPWELEEYKSLWGEYCFLFLPHLRLPPSSKSSLCSL